MDRGGRWGQQAARVSGGYQEVQVEAPRKTLAPGRRDLEGVMSTGGSEPFSLQSAFWHLGAGEEGLKGQRSGVGAW